mmetsp:Transcript_21280/g.53615  ORF Transcript_21280/g.53615 Transcript_21280/m.53615 type:complete len:225 (-) Transcript_21280:25-699(-)
MSSSSESSAAEEPDVRSPRRPRSLEVEVPSSPPAPPRAPTPSKSAFSVFRAAALMADIWLTSAVGRRNDRARTAWSFATSAIAFVLFRSALDFSTPAASPPTSKLSSSSSSPNNASSPPRSPSAAAPTFLVAFPLVLCLACPRWNTSRTRPSSPSEVPVARRFVEGLLGPPLTLPPAVVRSGSPLFCPRPFAMIFFSTLAGMCFSRCWRRVPGRSFSVSLPDFS